MKKEELSGLKKINFVKNKQTVILPSWWENIHFQGKWIMVWHFTPQKWFQSHLNSVLPKTRCLGMIVIMSWWHAPLVCLCQPFLSYYLFNIVKKTLFVSILRGFFFFSSLLGLTNISFNSIFNIMDLKEINEKLKKHVVLNISLIIYLFSHLTNIF